MRKVTESKYKVNDGDVIVTVSARVLNNISIDKIISLVNRNYFRRSYIDVDDLAYSIALSAR